MLDQTNALALTGARRKHEFINYTPFGFSKFARGRQIYVNIGSVFCKVSKKEFNKAAKGNRVNGFTFSDTPYIVWITYVG